MAGSVALQADVGNLSLAGLNSFRGLLGTLSMDDVQPGAMLQLQDIGSLFHASGPFASRVADELQRFSSYRMEKLAVTVGWRRNDAASLLAQSAGGQAVALLALFLGNTHHRSEVGQILFRLSNERLPKAKSIASVKQLAEVSSKVSGKLASMGYGNILAEQVTKLRLTYFSSNLPAPTCLLDDPTEEATIEILGAISRAQRETNVCARITGARGVGHIMALLLLLCANDVEITVENTIIHSGGTRRIFLNVLTSASHHNRYCDCPPTNVELETVLETMRSVPLLIQRTDYHRDIDVAFRWKGWLAARLEMVVAQHCSPKQHDLAEDCCNCIRNLFQLERTSRAWAALGTQPYRRIEEALVTMFDAHTWVPQDKDLRICLEAMISKINSEVNCSDCRTQMLPQLWRLFTNGSELFGEDFNFYGNAAETSCESHFYFWQQIIRILIQGFAGLWIDPGAKATVVMPPDYLFSIARMRDYLESPWIYWFPINQGDFTGLNRSISRDTSLLGKSIGSSVLYPAILHQLKMPPLFHVQYQLADGCFMLNGRYFEGLEAGSVTTRYEPGGFMEDLDVIKPIYLGPHELSHLTVSESLADLRLRLRINMDNRIKELHLGTIYCNYENHLKFTTPCDHSPETPLGASLMRNVKIPSNIFDEHQSDDSGDIFLYMTHKNRQMQFLCNCVLQEFEREHHSIMYMQDCCLNCAVQQALMTKTKKVGIIVS